MKSIVVVLVVLFSVPCFAQDRFQWNTPSAPYQQLGSTYDSNAMSLWRNRYDTDPPKLYSGSGQYLGRLSINPYVTDSIANPHSRYGSRYSPESINNIHGPFGRYGQPVYVQPRRW